MLYIIANASLSLAAKAELEKLGTVLWFQSSGITYPAIANHPDIFMAQTDNQLVVAPNTPKDFIRQLTSYKIPFVLGKKPVGAEYPYTASYNAVSTKDFFMHNLSHSDPVLRSLNVHKTQLNVRQGYTRCNCIALNDRAFITSDAGIFKKLSISGFDTCFVEPKQIILKEQNYGFFGGTAGIYNTTLFLNGKLSTLTEYSSLMGFLYKNNFALTELSSERLVDIGSLFFVEV